MALIESTEDRANKINEDNDRARIVDGRKTWFFNNIMCEPTVKVALKLLLFRLSKDESISKKAWELLSNGEYEMEAKHIDDESYLNFIVDEARDKLLEEERNQRSADRFA
jgi:hypothetical protein